MRLAEDRRARVPFALVGVLLLVGSAGLSATLAGDPPRTDESVGTAVERATAATNTAIRGAVASAGRQAARRPVVEPANTTAGRVLNDSTPFRDFLRIRIYLAVREALDPVAVRVGGVRASVSLPPTPNASALRHAKRRVEVESVGRAETGGLRVRIRNLTVTATRGGRVVERTELSTTLVVATPVLALHERVERFESRLNRGPLSPGLGRRLTARLSAVAWARGYAQYGRAPIENVVANRHVELAANGAILREQRVAFGRSDPAGRRALAWATARVGATDLLWATNTERARWARLLLAAARRTRRERPMPGGAVEGGRATPDVTVGINRTADRAFADLVTGQNGTDLDGVLRSAYAANARVEVTVRQTRTASRPSPEPPGANWTLRDTRVRTRTRVENATGSPPGAPRGWHVLRHGTRRVLESRALVATWTRGNETRRTVQRWTETFVVRVGVVGNHAADRAPARPVAGVHERAGALGGPNLRGISGSAAERLVAARGGFDALARRAVAGTLDTRPRRIAGRSPPELRKWVYRNLVGLRERVRNLSVTSSSDAVVGGTPPPAQLARKLRARRAQFLRAPDRYDGAADRARVAARAAYLDRVLARLDARAARANATRSGLDRALANAGTSLERVRRVLRVRTTPGTSPPRRMPAAGPGRPVELSVEGAPPYLTLAALDSEQVAAIPEGERRRPLAARNVNVFSVPYGDAADAVASSLGDASADRTDLRTAALALRAANRTLAERDNRTLARRRDALRKSLADSMRVVRRTLVERLGARLDLPAVARRAAVRDGLTRWNTTAGRALAVVNGSAADAVVAAAVRRRPSLRRADRLDWLRVVTELALDAARRRVDGPSRRAVDRVATPSRRIAHDAARLALADGLGKATERASGRWFGEVLGAVPAGLPVTPIPGYWYATVNVWQVSVRGRYARFAVRAPYGPPGESVVYVRRAATVRLDVDGDGDDEILGRTTPVSFETETTVAVVVPPGPPGVGDRDGDRDERSPGW